MYNRRGHQYTWPATDVSSPDHPGADTHTNVYSSATESHAHAYHRSLALADSHGDGRPNRHAWAYAFANPHTYALANPHEGTYASAHTCGQRGETAAGISSTRVQPLCQPHGATNRVPPEWSGRSGVPGDYQLDSPTLATRGTGVDVLWHTPAARDASTRRNATTSAGRDADSDHGSGRNSYSNSRCGAGGVRSR